MASFFALCDLAETKSVEETNEYAMRIFDNTMRDSKFIKECCQYLDKT